MKHLSISLAAASLIALSGSALAQTEKPGSPMKPSASAGKAGASQMPGKEGKRIVVGKVVEMRDIALKSGSGSDSTKHHIVVLESTKGKRVMVNTGLTERAPKDLKLSKGDRVVAIGKSARINGKPILVAQSIGELQPAGSIRK
jgi:molybdopterin-binding protein